MFGSAALASLPSNAEGTLPGGFPVDRDIVARQRAGFGDDFKSMVAVDNIRGSERSMQQLAQNVNPPRLPWEASPWASAWVAQNDYTAYWDKKVASIFLGTIFRARSPSDYELITRVFPIKPFAGGRIRVSKRIYGANPPDRLPPLGVVRHSAQTYQEWETVPTGFGDGAIWEDRYTETPDGIQDLANKMIQVYLNIRMGLDMQAMYTAIHAATAGADRSLRRLLGLINRPMGINSVIEQECEGFAMLMKGAQPWRVLRDYLTTVGTALGVQFDTLLVPQAVLSAYTAVHANELSFIVAGPEGKRILDGDKSLIEATTPGSVKIIPTRLMPAADNARAIDPLRTLRLLGDGIRMSARVAYRCRAKEIDPVLTARFVNFESQNLVEIDIHQCILHSGIFDSLNGTLTPLGASLFEGYTDLGCWLKGNGLFEQFVARASLPDVQAAITTAVTDTTMQRVNDAHLLRHFHAFRMKYPESLRSQVVKRLEEQGPYHLSAIAKLEADYQEVAALGRDVIPALYDAFASRESDFDIRLRALLKVIEAAVRWLRAKFLKTVKMRGPTSALMVDVCDAKDIKEAMSNQLLVALVKQAIRVVSDRKNTETVFAELEKLQIGADATDVPELKSLSADAAALVAGSYSTETDFAKRFNGENFGKVKTSGSGTKDPSNDEKAAAAITDLVLAFPFLGTILSTWVQRIPAAQRNAFSLLQQPPSSDADSVIALVTLLERATREGALSSIDESTAKATYAKVATSNEVKALLAIECQSFSYAFVTGLLRCGLPCFIDFLVVRPNIGIHTYNILAIDSNNAGNMFVEEPKVSVGRDAQRKQSSATIGYQVATTVYDYNKFMMVPNVMPIEYDRQVGGGGALIFDPATDAGMSSSDRPSVPKSIYILAIRPNEEVGPYFDITGYYPSQDLDADDTEATRGPHYSTCNQYKQLWRWNHDPNGFRSSVAYGDIAMTARMARNTKICMCSHSFKNPETGKYDIHVPGAGHWGSGQAVPGITRIYFGRSGVPYPQSETQGYE